MCEFKLQCGPQSPSSGSECFVDVDGTDFGAAWAYKLFIQPEELRRSCFYFVRYSVFVERLVQVGSVGSSGRDHRRGKELPKCHLQKSRYTIAQIVISTKRVHAKYNFGSTLVISLVEELKRSRVHLNGTINTIVISILVLSLVGEQRVKFDISDALEQCKSEGGDHDSGCTHIARGIVNPLGRCQL